MLAANCNVGKLAKAVSVAREFVPSRVSFPWERYARILTHHGEVAVTVDTIAAKASVWVPADVKGSGAAIVPVDEFHDALASLKPSDEVLLELEDGGKGIVLRAGQTKIQVDGPAFDELQGWVGKEIVASIALELSKLIDAVGFASVPVNLHSLDTFTSSIFVQAAGNVMALMGTDGYRISVATVSGTTATAPVSFAISAALMKKFIGGCNALGAAGGWTTITINRDQLGKFVTFFSSALTVSFRTSHVTIPDYRKMIGSDDDRIVVTVDRTQLLAQVTKVVASAAKDPVVLMTVGEAGITLESDGTASSVCLEKPAVADAQVYISGKHLYDGLRAFSSDNVTVTIATRGFRPVTIHGTDAGYVYTIMPVVAMGGDL